MKDNPKVVAKFCENFVHGIEINPTVYDGPLQEFNGKQISPPGLMTTLTFDSLGNLKITKIYSKYSSFNGEVDPNTVEVDVEIDEVDAVNGGDNAEGSVKGVSSETANFLSRARQLRSSRSAPSWLSTAPRSHSRRESEQRLTT